MTVSQEGTDYDASAGTAEAGSTVPLTIAPSEEFVLYGGSGDIYRVQIDDIVLADAKCLVTTVVYTKDGELHGSCTDSVESYSKRGEASNAVPLYRAIMKFAHSAYNYQINR